ncbi:MAG: DUF1501 domain-containing protein [Polyangiaceae bacterium]|nr:DUF1501 domain-containing protein [Polyangiaceae bacterium]
MTLSRRWFLRGASGAVGLASASMAMSRVLSSEAFAATLTGYAGYRCAVAVFLLGGSDSNNMLVPLTSNGSTGQYDRYLAARPTVGLKTASSELLAVNPLGLAAASYGVHFNMPKVRDLFETGRASFVVNVGPLVLPMNKDDYTNNTVVKPDSLFSHSDQQDAWVSAIANPSTVVLPAELSGVGPTGWGGRAADKLTAILPGDYPEVVHLSGRGLFGAGKDRAALAMSSSGAFGLKVTSDTVFNDLRDQSLLDVYSYTNSVAPEEAYGTIATAGIVYSDMRNEARDAAWAAIPSSVRDQINTAFGTATTDGAALAMSDGSIRAQLYQVIRDIIAGAVKTASGGLGLRRQIFQVGLGGFDTHTNQRAVQDSLFAQLDTAIFAFQSAIEHLEDAAASGGATGPLSGLAPQATLFTMSDFSRTLVENSDGGTDHAWGGHVLVVGSRVVGQKLFGGFPSFDLATGTSTTDSRGRWIPTICPDQIGNSIAYWLGATTAAERSYMFPNLTAFIDSAVARSFPSYTKSYRIGFLMADA